ncbi:MAG: tetratricopeptide repeat protein [bacterium]|nr:tetratricopeptide repeat protein [bacterium]
MKRYVRQEQYDLAAKELLSEGPRDAQGWALLAVCRYHSKDYAGLAEAAGNSLKLSQEFRSLLSYHLQKALIDQLRVAVKAYESGNDLEASQQFNQLLVFAKSIDRKMKPDIEALRDQIMSLAAESSFRLKNYPQALGYLETLAEQWKDNVELSERLAYTYYYMGQRDKCVATCERILKAAPLDANILGLRAQAVGELGKPDAAVNAYRDALACPVNQSVLNRNIGILLFTLKDWAQARTHLEGAIAGDPPQKAQLISMAAECCYYLGDYDAALAHYKHYGRIRPNDPDAVRAMGSCYLSKGDRTAADAAFTEAARLMRADSTHTARDSTSQPAAKTSGVGE